MLERLPKELLLEILNWLAQDGETSQGSVAILNLARSSHSFYQFVNWWVHTTAKLAPDLQHLCNVITKNFTYQPSFMAISVFCKRIGKICAICNNRAYHSRKGEIFTNLQLCKACESFLFPKISSRRLRKFFDLSSNSNSKPQHSTEIFKSIKQVFEKPYPNLIFRWSDVEEFVSNGSLTLNPVELRASQICGRWLSPEESSEFGCLGGRVVSLTSRQELFLNTLWWDSVFHWSHDGHNKFTAINIELILFKEFRYQFDSSWAPTTTEEEDLKVYSSFARYWATTQLVWQDRPWRLQNFPLPPRCSISNPHADWNELREDESDLARYQSRCSRFRAVIKAFPNILRCPEIWRRCVLNKKSRNSIAKAVETAMSAAKVWKESKETKIGFEIRPHNYHEPWLNVSFIRKGKDIKPTVLPSRVPVWGDIHAGSIIQIDGDSVELKSPFIRVSLTMEGKVLDREKEEESSEFI